MKIDYVKLTPEELQAIDGVLGEIPTKYGLPIVSILQTATNRRLSELQAEAEQAKETEAKQAKETEAAVETPEFMTPTKKHSTI